MPNRETDWVDISIIVGFFTMLTVGIVAVAWSETSKAEPGPEISEVSERLEELVDYQADLAAYDRYVAEKVNYLLCEMLAETEAYDGPAVPCLTHDGDPLPLPESVPEPTPPGPRGG